MESNEKISLRETAGFETTVLVGRDRGEEGEWKTEKFNATDAFDAFLYVLNNYNTCISSYLEAYENDGENEEEFAPIMKLYNDGYMNEAIDKLKEMYMDCVDPSDYDDDIYQIKYADGRVIFEDDYWEDEVTNSESIDEVMKAMQEELNNFGDATFHGSEIDVESEGKKFSIKRDGNGFTVYAYTNGYLDGDSYKSVKVEDNGEELSTLASNLWEAGISLFNMDEGLLDNVKKLFKKEPISYVYSANGSAEIEAPDYELEVDTNYGSQYIPSDELIGKDEPYDLNNDEYDLLNKAVARLKSDNDDLVEYMNQDKLASKIISIKFGEATPTDDGFDYTWIIEAKKKLEPEEIAQLKDYIDGQMSDGVGEGFEQEGFPAKIYVGEMVMIENPDYDPEDEESDEEEYINVHVDDYVKVNVYFHLWTGIEFKSEITQAFVV